MRSVFCLLQFSYHINVKYKSSINANFTQIWLLGINKNMYAQPMLNCISQYKSTKGKVKNTIKIMIIQNKVCIPHACTEYIIISLIPYYITVTFGILLLGYTCSLIVKIIFMWDMIHVDQYISHLWYMSINIFSWYMLINIYSWYMLINKFQLNFHSMNLLHRIGEGSLN